MQMLLKTVLLLLLTCSACSKPCDDTPPGVTLQNSSGSIYPARLLITDPTGTEKFSNNFVQAGASSNVLSVREGISTYTVILNISGQYEYISRDFSFETCNTYTINVYTSRNISQVTVSKN